MIFVTVGTHHQPFQRLLDALQSLPRDDLVVQFGHGSPPPGVAYARPFMDFAEMLEHFRAAHAVVTHAGVGSILCARREGHVPVVVPRSRRDGEHVDDHQAELTRALEERGVVIAAWDTDRLAEAVGSAASSVSPSAATNGAFPKVVRQALLR